jgi:hypothetical protein
MSRYFTLLIGCLSVSACVLSVDGYAPSSDPALDAALLGTWNSEGGGGRPAVAEISRADGGGLSIEYTDDDGKHGWFNGLAGHLGEHTVLDVWPLVPEDESLSDTYTGSLIAGHVLLVLAVEGDEIVVQVLDPDVVEADIESGALGVPITRTGEGSMILTGSYENLHSAFAAYLSRPGVFGDGEPSVWRRVDRP